MLLHEARAMVRLALVLLKLRLRLAHTITAKENNYRS